MNNENPIGLNQKNSDQIIDVLNVLLADHQIYYQNLRAFHWLIIGKNFFQLHEKFEELYNEAAENVDELAERILMLGGVPLHSYENYLGNANLSSISNVRNGNESLKIVQENMLFLLNKARELLKLAAEKDDEGTVAIMSELVSQYEKHLWMFSAFNAKID